MEIIVRNAQGWVDADGRVIDPIIKEEVGQSTPRFVSPGAVLLHFGRMPEVRDVVFRCMDYCCRELPAGRARGNGPDFWMRELVTAYMALEGVAGAGRLKRWAAGLSAVEGEKVYTAVSPDGQDIVKQANWAVYSGGGEAMRQAAGLAPDGDFLWGDAFFEKYVGGQLGLFTDNGMYRDGGDPITYDVTTRLQIANALAFGYAGPIRAVLEELLRRGGLTTLLFASPEGFCPYGGRSAAFHFREAILAALCELEARRYRDADAALAGAFKRQAHLSAAAMRRWIDMTPPRHIQNGFAPASRHGIDPYGNYSVYSLLAASFLGLAAIYADDAIAEAPCPAEKGGFVVELAPAFHKIFANCQGTYLEIDTAADQAYDATGLGRLAREGVPLELGLGMPLPKAGQSRWGHAPFLVSGGCRQPPEPMAIGPAWREGDVWVALAGLSEGLEHALKTVRETPRAVQFEIAYTHGKTTVTEDYLVERGKVSIEARVRQAGRAVPKMRFVVPLLVTDGMSGSAIEPGAHAVTVKYLGHAYQVEFPAAAKARIPDESWANRNGEYKALVLEADGDRIGVVLRLD